MNENLDEKLQTSGIPETDNWAGETCLIDMDLPPEFSWGRMAETRMMQFESALSDPTIESSADGDEDERFGASFYVVDEIYISSSEES
jgi:hypothetical protein